MAGRRTIDNILSVLNKMTDARYKVYIIGLLFTIGITLKEVLGSSYNNFQIFSYGSIDFWNGINPYSDWDHFGLRGNTLDKYLYGPVFSILFTPFTFLPGWISVFLWNIFTYTLFFFSVFTLPDKFSFVKKRFIFFYSVLLLFATLLSVQFNPVVAAIFMFSFTLLEINRGFWAVLLILISGFTKLYGIFQAIMLLFYPKFRRNTGYAIIIGIGFIFLPLVMIPADELAAYYQSWVVRLTDHFNALNRYSIYRPIGLIYNSFEPYMGYISLGVLGLISVFALLKLKLFKAFFSYRAQFLGILMSWAILFGVGSEKHTYVIAVAGYAIWYLCITPNRFDKVLLWTNLILLGVLPIDLLCPYVISKFILTKLNLGIIVFSITWMVMVYKTFFSSQSITDLQELSEESGSTPSGNKTVSV